MQKELSEADIALADTLVLIIGSLLVGGALNGKGMDDGLAYLRAEYSKKGLTAAPALIEYIRKRLTNPQNGPIYLRQLLESPSQGQA